MILVELNKNMQLLGEPVLQYDLSLKSISSYPMPQLSDLYQLAKTERKLFQSNRNESKPAQIHRNSCGGMY